MAAQSAKPAAHRVRLVLQTGGGLGVSRAAFSDDGKFALLTGNDGIAKLYDTTSGLELRVLASQGGEISGLAISHDSRHAAITKWDGTLTVWNLSSGALEKTFRVPKAELYSVAFSRDTRRVAAGGNRFTSYVWDLTTGSRIATLVAKMPFGNAMDGFAYVRFLPDGKRLFASGVTLVVFDIASQRPTIQEGLWRGALSADGRVLVTGLAQTPTEVSNGFQVIDVESGKKTILGRAEPDLWALYGDSRVAAIDNNKMIAHLWDLKALREIQQIKLPGGTEKPTYSAVFSSDGSELITSAHDGVLRVWSVVDGTASKVIGENDGATDVLSYSPDGQSIYGGCRVGLCRWNAASGAIEWSLGTTSHSLNFPLFAAGGGPLAVRQFLSTGGQINDAGILLLDRQTGEIRSIPAVGAFAFSHDGKRIFSGVTVGEGPESHGDMALWDVASRQRIALTFTNGQSPQIWNPHSVAFSPSGNLVAAGGDGVICVWNANTGEAIATIPRQFSEWFVSLEFSSDDTRLLSHDFNSDGTTVIWDLATKHELARIAGTSLASFTPDGRYVLTDHASEPAKLWDATTGRFVRDLPEVNFVTRVATLPGGVEAMAGSADGFIITWNIATGQVVRRFKGPDGGLNFDLSDDGSLLAIVNDHKLQIWDAKAGRELATVVSFLDSTWAVVDPDGRYDASDPNRVHGIHWVVGDEPIEFEQMKGRFYTHGLLEAVFKHESLLPLGEKLEQIRMYPNLDVETPAAGSESLHVKLTDRGDGIGRVIVKVNGNLVFDQQAPSSEFDINLPNKFKAENGHNLIEASATAVAESVTSRGVKVAWQTAPTQATAHKLYALLVGASKFSGGVASMDLRYPAKDAANMGRAIEIGTRKLFDQTIVRVLASDSPDPSLLPTKANILREFAGIAHAAAPSDTVLLYLAGHGIAKGADSYFFLTQDAHSTDLDSEAVRWAWALSSEEIGNWFLSDLKSAKRVIILDTCAAGAAEKALDAKIGEKREPPRDLVQAIEKLNDRAGSHILMGSAADKVSYESNRYGQGLLTYALLEGMKGAAQFRDQSLFVDAWFESAENEVETLSRKEGPGGVQRPYSKIWGQDFPIAYLDDAEKNTIPLAAARTVVLQAVCLTPNFNDPSKLGPQVREDLRAMDQPAGPQGQQPGFIYLDDVSNGKPDAVIPRVNYSISGDGIVATIILVRDGTEEVLVKSPELRGPKNDVAKLAAEIAQSIAKLVP